MVLMNSSNRARHISSITNQNQGGGSKKAGFPYQVGRSSWTGIAFNSLNPITGNCCNLKSYNYSLMPLANISRPIGRNTNNSYWHIKGT